MEAPTPTATPVWESTFDECIERCGGTPMRLETPTSTAAPVWESTFDECIERRGGEPMGLEISMPRAQGVKKDDDDKDDEV